MRSALDIPVRIVGAFVPYDQLGISTRTFTAMDTATYAVLSSFTILVTGLIAARLLLARRQHMKIMGQCLMIYKCAIIGLTTIQECQRLQVLT
jgi:hypothetical protein